MAIFRRRKGDSDAEEFDERDELTGDEFADDDFADYPEGSVRAGDTEGPFDSEDAPDDGVPRLDLGSLRLPVPDGAQLQVEMDNETGGIRAIHLLTEVGQLTLSGYAAPRSGGLWREVGKELADQLRSDGARVVKVQGEWGQELLATVNDVTLRFIGVDGERWMLRAVSAGPEDRAEEAMVLLRDIVRNTVVVRGDAPMPVRTPLAVQLPPEIAEQIEQAKAQEADG